MILDCHIHTDVYSGTPEENQRDLLEKMHRAGVSGGVLLSLDPTTFSSIPAAERMDRVLALCGSQKLLFPFYWIDPTAEGAVSEVDAAQQKGIAGLKIICSGYYPGDPRVLAVCRRAAALGLPVLFHSGILWDGKDSSRYNRPSEFESLLEIPHLRFSLAHVSWPWCDECIAVYGKVESALSMRKDLSCEMFVDLTPGTPRLWREEVFKKLLCSGYHVRDNILFGSDCNTADYDAQWTAGWMELDNRLYRQLLPEDAPALMERVYHENLLRFIGRR